jgi:hypothetical protein
VPDSVRRGVAQVQRLSGSAVKGFEQPSAGLVWLAVAHHAAARVDSMTTAGET